MVEEARADADRLVAERDSLQYRIASLYSVQSTSSERWKEEKAQLQDSNARLRVQIAEQRAQLRESSEQLDRSSRPQELQLDCETKRGIRSMEDLAAKQPLRLHLHCNRAQFLLSWLSAKGGNSKGSLPGRCSGALSRYPLNFTSTS